MPYLAGTAVAVTALIALMSCGATPATAAVSAEQAVAHLNAQRAANGIPGPLVHSPTMSDGCAKHNNYIALNGGGLTHVEESGRPGYTPEGARIAPGSGSSEVLAGGGGRWDDAWVNPWSDAPLHLLGMFDPSAGQAGYADDQRVACMRFGGFRAVPAGVYSLPGNGATGVPPGQDTTGEGPYSPADVAGVSDRSGYNILVWRFGATNDIAQARLTGPVGAVDMRTVDSRSPTPGGGRWVWGGAVIVPVKALDAGATYSVDVTFTDGAVHHSSFRTAPRDPKLELRISGGADGTLTVYAPALAAITATRASGPGGVQPMTADPTDPHRFFARGLRPGFYTACVQAGGPGSGYSPAVRCDRAEVRATQAVSVRTVKGRRVRVTVGKAFIAARKATLTMRNARGRTLKVYRFRLATRSFKRPKGSVSYTLKAKPAGGYMPVSLANRLR